METMNVDVNQQIGTPGSLDQLFIITKYELLNYFRSKRFLILLIIGLIIDFILTGIIGYYRPQSFLSSTLSFYGGWVGQSITFIIILSAIFFGGDSISGEFQNKTGFFIASRPIRRSSIYIGKWIASFVASLLIMFIFLAITIANGIYYFGYSIPYQLGDAILFSILYLAAVLGFAFFFSSLFKSSAYSILITIILFLFAFTLMQDLISSLVGIEPWFIITYAAGIITNVFTVPFPAQIVHSATQVGPKKTIFRTIYNATIPEGLIIMAGYFIISTILGLFIFEKREFN